MATRTPDEKSAPLGEIDKKPRVSPGRYSIADEDEVPPMRIDSTTMPAVRADGPMTAIARVAVPRKPLPVGPPPLPRTSGKRAGSEKPPKKAASEKPAARPPSIAPPPEEPRRRRSSLRPPAMHKPTSVMPPALAVEAVPLSLGMPLDGFDEGSIAFAFDSLLSDGPGGLPGTMEMDLSPVRELFAELAANHMRHVRDFMIDVKWGDVTRDWINICVPPVRTLTKAADRLELAELREALSTLATTLDELNATGGQMLDAAEKQRLLEAYESLVTLLPQAFALDRDKTLREGVIVQALLLQVPDVRKVTIDKLHAAGLTGLAVLFEANAGDIAHVAGIPDTLAAKIVERVQAYRAEMMSASPSDARAAEREKLATLTGQLKTHHEAYEAAAGAWSADAKARKRDGFRAREDKWLEISVLLARFGEVDRLAGIEKVPFAQRIGQLADYLDEAREKYRAE